jgi:2-hydroxy-6-oxonona-2,4-dienedioate hydrolase
VKQKEGKLNQLVVAPDMPGHGRSPGPREALGMEELADWTARLLDTLAIPCAHVAAHSMGCQVALALARRHPARVGSMVLASPTTGRRLIAPWRYLLGMVNSFREPLSYKPTALRLYRRMGFRRYLATVRKMLEDDPLREITAVRAPCLVVSGEWDAIVPMAVARALAEALPYGSFLRIRGAAHVVPFHQPEAFTRALLEFLVGTRTEAPQLMRPEDSGPEPGPMGRVDHGARRVDDAPASSQSIPAPVSVRSTDPGVRIADHPMTT